MNLHFAILWSAQEEKSRTAAIAIRQIVEDTITNVMTDLVKDPDIEIPDLSDYIKTLSP